MFASIRIDIVDEAGWTFEWNCYATDANVEAFTTKRFRIANWIGIIAIGLVRTIDDGSNSSNRYIRWGLSRLSWWTS